MAESLTKRLKNAWNVFRSQDEEDKLYREHKYSEVIAFGSRKPDRVWTKQTAEKSIIDAIYTRLSIDFSSVSIRHVRLDEEDRYTADMNSGLQECLTVDPNLDQGPRAIRQDFALSLFDKGVIAIVPVDTTLDPNETGAFDINSIRVGYITKWYAKSVMVSVYNENSGKREEVEISKKIAAIVENPFYSVMNEPNSTLQRLNRKLSLLDVVDEQSSSGKLDIIIQLPYVIRGDKRQEQANNRRTSIEEQLNGSKYGIAYIDGTEKVIQLNRPAENNLLTQVEFLTALLYSQLGLTEEIMKGTADEQTMINYLNRTIEPLLDAVVESMHRRFLTKTARSQRQAIRYFQDPFKLVPVSQIAEISDKLRRNEIASPNDIRNVLGWKPSKDAKSDQVQNSNMPSEQSPPQNPANETQTDVDQSQQ